MTSADQNSTSKSGHKLSQTKSGDVTIVLPPKLFNARWTLGSRLGIRPNWSRKPLHHNAQVPAKIETAATTIPDVVVTSLSWGFLHKIKTRKNPGFLRFNWPIYLTVWTRNFGNLSNTWRNPLQHLRVTKCTFQQTSFGPCFNKAFQAKNVEQWKCAKQNVWIKFWNGLRCGHFRL